jgi:HAD superfamily hydrolase (TIGR01662 family)
VTLKAILFDLDDTLINWGNFSEQWEKHEIPHVEKVYTHFQQVGAGDSEFSIFKEAYFKRTRKAWLDARHTLIAPHLGRVLVDAALDAGIPREHADMQTLLDVYQWTRVPTSHTFPEVPAILTRLRAAGIKLGIVTNAYQPMRLRDVELEAHGLLDYFPDCRISAADAGYLKPHPSIFQQALERIGSEPENTVFIGDNPTADIAGGQSAGMKAILRVVGRTWPLISGVIIPDAAINSLEELPTILDEWFPGWEG